MNAKYLSHKQVWQILKPKVDVWLEATEPLRQVRPPTLATVAALLDWSVTAMDPAALAHGVRELASPLSE